MSITVTDAFYNSSDSIHKIHAVVWKDDEKAPVGVFQIAHGVAEHIERYDEFARFLVSLGWVVAGNDHLGHGKSVNTFDELGFIAKENGDVRMVDDMHILYNIMSKRYPGVPYVLFGHSMGSMLARHYCTVFGYELSGAIFCGTGGVPYALNNILPTIKNLIAKFGPESHKVDLFSMMTRGYNKDYAGENDEYAWLSKNVQNRENYRNDPYCGFPLSMGGFRDLSSVAVKISSPDWAYRIPVDLPILFISGAQDPVGGNGKWIIKAADDLEMAGLDPEVILYPGDRHEILNEDNKQTVMNDVAKWLGEKVLAQ